MNCSQIPIYTVNIFEHRLEETTHNLQKWLTLGRKGKNVGKRKKEERKWEQGMGNRETSVYLYGLITFNKEIHLKHK